MPDKELNKKLVNVITHIHTAIVNTNLYFPDHPEVNQNIDIAYEDIIRILSLKPEISIVSVNDEIVISNKPIKSDSSSIRHFIRVLQKNRIEHVTFIKGLTQNEFKDFINKISSSKTISLKSSTYIKLGKIKVDNLTSKKKKETEENPLDAINVIKIKELYNGIKYNDGEFNVLTLVDIVNAFTNVFKRGQSPLKLLALIRNTDEYTFTHVVNVCILTMSQAESLGFTGNHLQDIGTASILHDVGKLFIPETILNKPGALDPEERKIIEKHTVKGAMYILGLTDVSKIAVLGALEHHIKHDGTGYPKLNADYKPNIVSQLISISDAYDAMRSKRPYQDAMPRKKIFSILREECGTSFDPLLVENFINILP